MSKIEAVMHISRHTISAVYKTVDSHSISWDNVKNFDEFKVYELLFVSSSKTSVFKDVVYDYIHSELKKTGVNLNLLWNEYCNHCISRNDILCGYTKFCEGYSEYSSILLTSN